MPRKAPAPPADVRERVLEAAIQLLEEEGIAALSLREVARRAGVSHQTPYHHFKAREDILAALCEQGFAMLAGSIERARAAAPDPVAAYEAAGHAYVTFAVRHKGYFRLMFRPELVNIAAHPGAMQGGDRAFAHVPELVRDLVARGLPAEPSVQAMVALTWASVHGLACLLLDGPMAIVLPDFEASRDASVRDVMRAMAALIENGMRPPSRPKAAKKRPR